MVANLPNMTNDPLTRDSQGSVNTHNTPDHERVLPQLKTPMMNVSCTALCGRVVRRTTAHSALRHLSTTTATSRAKWSHRKSSPPLSLDVKRRSGLTAVTNATKRYCSTGHVPPPPQPPSTSGVNPLYVVGGLLLFVGGFFGAQGFNKDSSSSRRTSMDAAAKTAQVKKRAIAEKGYTLTIFAILGCR